MASSSIAWTRALMASSSGSSPAPLLSSCPIKSSETHTVKMTNLSFRFSPTYVSLWKSNFDKSIYLFLRAWRRPRAGGRRWRRRRRPNPPKKPWIRIRFCRNRSSKSFVDAFFLVLLPPTGNNQGQWFTDSFHEIYHLRIPKERFTSWSRKWNVEKLFRGKLVLFLLP